MRKMETLVNGFKLVVPAILVTCLAGPAVAPAAAEMGKGQPSTPHEMVATYDALADVILAVKHTEASLVRSILGATYAHAQVELGRARHALKGGDAPAAQAAVENLAADVAFLGTEGDNAVAAIRKRLLDGGHHHNAAGEAQGIYDDGFVVVTKKAKQALLDSSRAIGQMARAPKADALDAEWTKVEATWSGLMKTGG